MPPRLEPFCHNHIQQYNLHGKGVDLQGQGFHMQHDRYSGKIPGIMWEEILL
jgi:hypothetical protein